MRFSPLSPFFLSQWGKEMKAFTNILQAEAYVREKGKLQRTSFNYRLNGLIQDRWQNSPWKRVSGEPTAEDKKQERQNWLPQGAFLIVCCYSIWQQKDRFWKKSGDTVKLVTNQSRFSSGKPGFQFAILTLQSTWSCIGWLCLWNLFGKQLKGFLTPLSPV